MLITGTKPHISLRAATTTPTIALILLSALLLTVSCRKEETVISASKTEIPQASRFEGGFYLLNEGNMGSNKCTLDRYDGDSRTYWRNIFPWKNPGIAMELGDVGNDLKINGDRLYAVINCSNLVEVMKLADATHIAQIPIANCRYICFDSEYAYVSSYAGRMVSGPGDRLGRVVRIDLNTLTIAGECETGYQPEEMVIYGKRLFVANSGGYNAPDYDDRISIIDLESFSPAGEIRVAPNLHRMALCSDGSIWVNSRGNYADIPSRLLRVDPDDFSVISTGLSCNGFCEHDGTMYLYGHDGDGYIFKRFRLDGSDYSASSAQDCGVEGIRYPYGIYVNPWTDELLILDAGDFVTPGKLLCYDREGKLLWTTTTGDIPSRIAFFEGK